MIRNPGATRPWQHVLEPLNGYLPLAEGLLKDPEAFSEGWNFGPDPAGTGPSARWSAGSPTFGRESPLESRRRHNPTRPEADARFGEGSLAPGLEAAARARRCSAAHGGLVRPFMDGKGRLRQATEEQVRYYSSLA